MFELLDKSRPRSFEDPAYLIDRSEAERAEAHEQCRRKLRDMCATLRSSGNTRIKLIESELTVEGMSCRMQVDHLQDITMHDELYRVHTLNDGERKLFSAMKFGVPNDLSNVEYLGREQQAISSLGKQTWACQMSIVDWFIVGAAKSMYCACLRAVRFDEWVDKCHGSDARYDRALRRSVGTKMLFGDRRTLRYEFSYKSRGILKIHK